MQAFLDFSNLSNSVNSLCVIYDRIENHTRGLEALEKTQDIFGIY